ncbi:MAG: CRISPR-associated endonuclease Cas2 [Chloroflexota bacterium]
MEVLITYDVSTESSSGRRRLRQVAKLLEGHGQRVQKSVFECIVNPEQLEVLVHRLTRIIDTEMDSLRVYRLREPRERFVRIVGQKPAFDPREPMIV